jgi:Asp-tRNA(Asn)/Glu-tRNA(Gln) amidotransferase A subunit family amidase
VSDATTAPSATRPAPSGAPGLRRPFLPARERFLAGGETPRDYLEACLRTIEAREPTVHAFAALDVGAARRSADESAARYRAGAPLSPIDGMPIAIKDIIETADLPTQFGSPVFAGWRGGRDSAAAWALRRAGAVIVGKAVTTEFAGATPARRATRSIRRARRAGRRAARPPRSPPGWCRSRSVRRSAARSCAPPASAA